MSIKTISLIFNPWISKKQPLVLKYKGRTGIPACYSKLKPVTETHSFDNSDELRHPSFT
ncbi:hypothetical protein DFP97_104312 [Paenibacillus prosopidis]|uniref:Uncharacterized protein n=1 Tax=Paenibacillus prosopidis TaxID=630520 RepID=A0A368W5V7_9BACL|nr:hypothetical protein DFP97_104312 [Paenibacillus prosopidis]